MAQHQLFVKYAVNLIKNEVQMIDGQIRIAPGGWKGITSTEITHPDIIYALRQEWIRLSDTEPKTPETPSKKKLDIINSDDPAFSGEKEPRAKVSKLGTTK